MQEIAPQQNNNQLDTLLTALNLRCVRGENVLFKDLSFKIKSGECLHIIGANGCGKTSLLRILCGLNLPESGAVQWLGQSLQASEAFFSESAYLGHKDGIKGELTAIENLRFQQNLESISDEDHLDTCLMKLQILQCADLPAQVLSFGQRRRLAFAKLLLSTKRIWILDEPFTGIDTSGRTLMEQLCVEHLEKAGAIILTHHQSLENSDLNRFKTELRLHAND